MLLQDRVERGEMQLKDGGVRASAHVAELRHEIALMLSQHEEHTVSGPSMPV